MPTIHEIDVWVAEYVLGHQIIRQKKGTIKERTREGHIRPLRRYSKDMNAAWEVCERLGVTLLPVKEAAWFALVGNGDGWESPAELFQYLQAGDFVRGGAAVTKSAPLSICLAALRSIEKREALAFEGLNTDPILESGAEETEMAESEEQPEPPTNGNGKAASA